MKNKLLFGIFFFFILALISFTHFTLAPRRKWYSFEIILPDLVEGRPGETVLVEGGVLNQGFFWLHKFNLSISGLPYKYEINPSYFEHLRILRAWNPERGVYRVPVNFTIKIYLPEDAIGAHLVNVTGKEYRSWRKVSNSSIFILRVISNITKPNVTISDLEIPEIVRPDEKFNITFRINNFERIPLKINTSVIVPSGWEVEKTKTVLVEANTSEKVSFTITPSNTSGNVLVYLEYPYGLLTFNLTKYGAFLVPVTEIPELPKPKEPTLLERIITQIKKISPVVLAVGGLVLIIIIWNLLKILRFYKVRKKPERVKKEVEINEAEII